jgi:hypothetical protein
MKSSLKTFLAGKNRQMILPRKLKGSTTLGESVGFEECDFNNTHFVEDTSWYIDVLDDGTAITYCAD